ncbi:MAG: hypothetical protein ACRDQA_02910 [Nocardioidaceae bacterium]
MDLTETIVAKSDQLNADDLLSGPRTFTITEVRRGDPEQPVQIVLAEFPENRPFKPSKTVLRVLVHALGKETDDWPPQVRMTLYRDASVKWAGQAIGGIRISHLSHIDEQIKVALAESKGKKTLHVVDPLPADAPTSPAVSAELLAELTATFERKDIPEDARLEGANRVTGGSATDLETLTEAEAQQVLASLESRPDVAPVEAEPDPNPQWTGVDQ